MHIVYKTLILLALVCSATQNYGTSGEQDGATQNLACSDSFIALLLKSLMDLSGCNNSEATSQKVTQKAEINELPSVYTHTYGDVDPICKRR